MIEFSEGDFDVQALLDSYPSGNPKAEMLSKLINSTHVYRYSSSEELIFEIGLRANIIDASVELFRSRLAFRIFRDSKCNEDFWHRRSDGGFVLRSDVKASDAINDIYRHTRLYGTECATAIVIIYYKAVLGSYGADLFNTAFRSITLMNWQDMDDLMGVTTYRGQPDYIPGDCRYFRNPDVNPLTPEWQGENAIDLGGGRYYGHGIGITNADGIINALNRNRVEGSQISAYLMDSATRPHFKRLYRYWKNST